MFHYTCVEDVVKPGDGIILDAFGVFWAGGNEGFYPGSLAVFERLAQKGVFVVILSNGTMLSAKAQSKYASGGLKESFYVELLTSGEITRQLFLDEARLLELGLKAPRKTYWVYKSQHPLYGSPHVEIFKGTGYVQVETLEEADFIYAGIPHAEGQDQKDSKIFEKELVKLVLSNKPMVVANPDRFVQEGDGELFVRQGEIGRLYELAGGKVFVLGKPSNIAFEAAVSVLKQKGVSKDSIWMVGDNSETDILGGNNYGIRTLLVVETGVTYLSFLEAQKNRPDLTMNLFVQEMPKQYQPTAILSHFGSRN
jgi:HAD superfamily hydrolase (TIGR01459 family)